MDELKEWLKTKMYVTPDMIADHFELDRRKALKLWDMAYEQGLVDKKGKVNDEIK